ncbi:glycosyltransferase family 4 protein [Adhaeribacter rhizoryzae]|uniref:Glycosyltransferase family 4 protein n=1 Tax=Adhaeribacter rhizoryzae TaxID=2607907 RepID=A0A5M6DQ62_9BACT|nr:glycosyltransferase family 4 protein [Adhaeribacter rhizoryzae]KAA5548320.1 glycosyltransferase family 4 protein [Adhaeribacter rhizoryzae]
MNILITVETLVTGGAETFALRFAQALSKDHKVFLYRFYDNLIDQDIVNKLAPDVKKLTFKHSLDEFLRKFDSLLNKINIEHSLRNLLIKKHLKKIIKKHNIQVVHSNQFKVDYVTTEVANSLNIPIVTTIHGDYLRFWEEPPKSIISFKTKIAECVAITDAIVCISDYQLAFFQEKIQPLVSKKINLVKIYNGYPFYPALLQNGRGLKQKINIPPENFVFGMVSRGIPGKGWDVAIEAFIKLAEPNTNLILVGHSDYLNSLKAMNGHHKNIHFVGYSSEPINWINNFDVGLLPSNSDNLPTVIIEYLFCGKPVIASDVGEIKNMIALPNGNAAGNIVPLNGNKVSSELLKNEMQRYINDKTLFREHAKNALLAAQKFNMDNCVSSYVDLYNKKKNQLETLNL